MKRNGAENDGDDLIEEIGDVAAKIDKLTAIRSLMTEVETIAELTAENWTPRGQPSKLLRMQLDRLLQKVSQHVPHQFHSKHGFLLPSNAAVLDAKKMLFNAYMAAGVWMLAEWDDLRS